MGSKRTLLSVVIPVFNEEDSISRILTEVEVFLAKKGWVHEIIVINDGSKDRTGQVVRNWSRVQHPVILLENIQNRGRGYAAKQGIFSSHGEWILFIDTDGAAAIRELEELWPLGPSAVPEYDLAVGSRHLQSSMGKIFTGLANLILWTGISDLTCGFKCFHREAALKVFRNQRIERWGFDAEVLFLARKNHFRIKEFPVHGNDADKSHVYFFRDTITSFWELFKIRWNQLLGYYRD